MLKLFKNTAYIILQYFIISSINSKRYFLIKRNTILHLQSLQLVSSPFCFIHCIALIMRRVVPSEYIIHSVSSSYLVK